MMSNVAPPRSPEATHTSTQPGWMEQVQEPILEPGLPIIDPRYHSGMTCLRASTCKTRWPPTSLLATTCHATVYLQCGLAYRPDGPEVLRSVGETEAAAAVATLSEVGAYGPP